MNTKGKATTVSHRQQYDKADAVLLNFFPGNRQRQETEGGWQTISVK
jgi:hypothetical protein